jgi:hypothetical protein
MRPYTIAFSIVAHAIAAGAAIIAPLLASFFVSLSCASGEAGDLSSAP